MMWKRSKGMMWKRSKGMRRSEEGKKRSKGMMRKEGKEGKERRKQVSCYVMHVMRKIGTKERKG